MLFAALCGRTAHAEPTEAARVEARERFDRGLRLFNQQDSEGALAEFRRAYELMPHPLVLYNIGLVLSESGSPVQAVEVFDKLLANPAGLDADRMARVQTERTSQATRIGEIAVRASVEGASVELDGLEVGHVPLGAPIRAATGSHIVGVTAAGYAPLRKQVSVAGQTRTEVAFELVAVEGRLAQLAVGTRLLDAEVVVDGNVVGKTPLSASLALAAGEHAVEIRRPGYRPASQKVALGAGSVGKVELEPVADPSALAREGGRLELAISEPDSVVSVDGAPHAASGALVLPRGVHLLRVERAGFYPFERKVDVPRGSASRVSVELQPTPDFRASYRGRTTTQRTWGWISLGAGAAIAAGGAGFVILNKAEESDKKDAYEELAASNQRGGGGDCDPEMQRPPDCVPRLNQAVQELEDVRSREKFGWIGLGVGVAAAGVGAVLLVTNDDPDRYEPRPESDVFGVRNPRALPWIDPTGGGGLALGARF